jgi:hypothetical protein
MRLDDEIQAAIKEVLAKVTGTPEYKTRFERLIENVLDESAREQDIMDLLELIPVSLGDKE